MTCFKPVLEPGRILSSPASYLCIIFPRTMVVFVLAFSASLTQRLRVHNGCPFTTGKGIGGINLGARVQDVLAIMQKHPDVFKNVDVKFCAEDLGSMDLLIECQDIGMNVICGAREQRVRLIEFYRPRDFTILYCDVPCCGPKVLPTFPAVYHQLGPAMPGVYKEDTQMYWLVYPGVTFMFPISVEFAHMFKNERHLTMVLPDGSTPVASRIRIHPMHDSVGQAPPPLEEFVLTCESAFLSTKPGNLYMEPVDVKLDGTISFNWRGCLLDFSSTPQDVVGQLGQPSSIMQKRVDKLRIHAKQATGCAHYFFNYADLGIDILFDARQHSIRKLVLHTNCPEHADFNDYTKCNFRLALPRRKLASSSKAQKETNNISTQGCGVEGKHGLAEAASVRDDERPEDRTDVVEIGPDTTWSVIESILGPPIGGKPLIHTDRALGAASGHSLFFGYDGWAGSLFTLSLFNILWFSRVIFEVTRLGNLATVILYRR